MKVAIKYSELIEIANKYKCGDYVMWESLTEAAECHLVRFTGVGRVNSLQFVINAAECRINDKNRYCKTIEEVAYLMGVSRKTLHSWQSGWGLTLTQKRIPAYRNGKAYLELKKIGYAYDAKDVLKQLKQKRKEKGG